MFLFLSVAATSTAGSIYGGPSPSRAGRGRACDRPGLADRDLAHCATYGTPTYSDTSRADLPGPTCAAATPAGTNLSGDLAASIDQVAIRARRPRARPARPAARGARCYHQMPALNSPCDVLGRVARRRAEAVVTNFVQARGRAI